MFERFQGNKYWWGFPTAVPVFFLTIVVGVFFAQPCISSEISTTSMSTLVCDEPQWNFGRQSNYKTPSHTFILKNTGNEPLEILRIPRSCGCLVVELPKNSLDPGEAIGIVVQAPLLEYLGPFHRTVGVETNSRDTPMLTLDIIGEVYREIDIDPSKVDFGQIAENTLTSRTVRLVHNAEGATDNFKILSVELDSEYLSVETSETLSEELKLSHEIRVTTNGNLERGFLRSQLLLRTNNEDFPELTIPVLAYVAGELIVEPHELILVESTSSGSGMSRYISIRPGTIKDFQIQSVSISDSTVDYKIIQRGTNGSIIQISNLSPTQNLDGNHITIETDAEGMEQIIIPIRVVELTSSVGSEADYE